MGLDMYLRTNSRPIAESMRKHSPEQMADWFERDGTAVYWRKAEAVHKWFVDHVQGGRDDCDLYEVPLEKLEELRDVCETVSHDWCRASELLPCEDYGEAYRRDVVFTGTALADLMGEIELRSDHGWEFAEAKGDPGWAVRFEYVSSR